MNRAETYKNEKIYLYHGTNKKLHNMDGKKEDIELLGFLSTTLNIYTASFYSEVGLKGNGFIYIIEVDESKTYINLNDNLYQFILLPHSIIRIVHEFDYIGITIILCRLIETPTKEQSNELYNKLLVAAELGEEDKKTTGGFRKTKAVVGDYLQQIIPTYKKEKVKEQGMRKSSGTKREEANNKINASISGYKSMYKFEDLPKDFQKYYGKQNKGKDIDISNGCHIGLVPRKD